MDNVNLASIDEVILQGSPIEIKEIKDKNNKRVGEVKFVSRGLDWKGFSILDSENNLMIEVKPQNSLTVNKESFSEIYEPNNNLLAVMTSRKLNGGPFGGNLFCQVDVKNDNILFNIVARYSDYRFTKLTNLKILKNNEVISTLKKSFWRNKWSIKLKEHLDMRIVIASFIEFYYCDGRRIVIS